MHAVASEMGLIGPLLESVDDGKNFLVNYNL